MFILAPRASSACGTADKNWVGHEEVELREHARGSLSSLLVMGRSSLEKPAVG